LKFTTLRYANVFGPRQNPRGEAGVVSIFIRQMLQGEIPTIFGDGSKTRDYVFVEDVVSANLLALGASRCGTFNIGRGVQVSDYEIFSAIRQELGFAHEPKYAPPRAGEVEHICLNAGAAANGLRWKPDFSLREGIKRTVAYVRSELQNALTGDSAGERAIEQSVSEPPNWKVASQR
jgi:UDP-glucose 4-epimerase